MAEEIMGIASRHPGEMQKIKKTLPDLYAAVDSYNVDKVILVLREIQAQDIKDRLIRGQYMLNTYNRPLSPDTQRLYDAYKAGKDFGPNMEAARKMFPDLSLLGPSRLLFIYVIIRGVKLRALVDTSAQHSVIRSDVAKSCKLFSLVDRRVKGTVFDEKAERIVGRIHLAGMKIGHTYIPFSCVVVDRLSVDFVFGLDIMRRCRCTINLRENRLHLGPERIRFLDQRELYDGTLVGAVIELLLRKRPTLPAKKGLSASSRRNVASRNQGQQDSTTRSSQTASQEVSTSTKEDQQDSTTLSSQTASQEVSTSTKDRHHKVDKEFLMKKC
ncbi:DNA damage-inducible protein 1 [Babesia sp. Xinjiang]|uniref:DNA damage-inducible protein 1 n=1 Tax=Babesia sp. Xinjiang TaxID=462227 RepID=UPI000A264F84|nr:DNA damage-inducible protein 1 [Babesia sp. Xinjiang]ORM41834.1 DNA damage-inducible protein 1 [Babesia sp. Xinjiang]